MNRKVLKSMIILLWTFFIGFTVIKLFFAEWFVDLISNENIRRIGSVIDSSYWLTLLADSLLGTLVLHFYLCACKSVWKLHRIEYGCIFLYSLTSAFLQPIIPTVIFWAEGICMIVVPILMRVNWKRVITIFLAHDVGQMLILFIRSQPMYLEGADYVTSLILMFDVYIWLLLYYLYANMYKEVKKNGNSRS